MMPYAAVRQSTARFISLPSPNLLTSRLHIRDLRLQANAIRRLSRSSSSAPRPAPIMLRSNSYIFQRRQSGALSTLRSGAMSTLRYRHQRPKYEGLPFNPVRLFSSTSTDDDDKDKKKAINPVEFEKVRKISKAKLADSGNFSRYRYLNPKFIATKIWNLLVRLKTGTVVVIRDPNTLRVKFKSGWKHFKEEMKHYWASTKLLWYDIKECSKIVSKKVLRGKKLNYRERKQLVRTSGDIFRMIPFSLFILIPALEIFLPLAIWLFPGLLPSTFAKKSDKEDKLKKQLELRLNLAEFFKESAENSMKSLSGMKESHKENIQEIVTTMKSGGRVKKTQLVKVASLFDDTITLDNSSTEQLKKMCQFMNLSTFGSDQMLRRRLEWKMSDIRKDDKDLKNMLDDLNHDELKTILAERGMRPDQSLESARKMLSAWFSLSLSGNIPISLLIMSQMFNIQYDHKLQKEAVSASDMLEGVKIAIETEISEKAVDHMLVEKAGVIDHQKEAEVVKRQSSIIQEQDELADKMDQIDKMATAQSPESAEGVEFHRDFNVNALDQTDRESMEANLERKMRQSKLKETIVRGKVAKAARDLLDGHVTNDTKAQIERLKNKEKALSEKLEDIKNQEVSDLESAKSEKSQSRHDILKVTASHAPLTEEESHQATLEMNREIERELLSLEKERKKAMALQIELGNMISKIEKQLRVDHPKKSIVDKEPKGVSTDLLLDELRKDKIEGVEDYEIFDTLDQMDKDQDGYIQPEEIDEWCSSSGVTTDGPTETGDDEGSQSSTPNDELEFVFKEDEADEKRFVESEEKRV